MHNQQLLRQRQNEVEADYSNRRYDAMFGIAFKDRAFAKRLVAAFPTIKGRSEAYDRLIATIENQIKSTDGTDKPYEVTRYMVKDHCEQNGIIPNETAATISVFNRCMMETVGANVADADAYIDVLKVKAERTTAIDAIVHKAHDGSLSLEQAKEYQRQLKEGQIPNVDGKRKANLLSAADIEPKAVDWLWDGYIPLGAVTLIAGRQGDGKSTIVSDLTARISNGSTMPNGGICKQGGTVWLTAEESYATDIIPRLKAHGADLHNVTFLDGVKGSDTAITLSDVDIIEDAIQQTPNCKLLVIDPLGGFLGGDVDANADNQVRSSLKPLKTLAAKHGIAVVIVCHLNKDESRKVAVNMINGSTGISGFARVAYMVLRDKSDRQKRYFAECKRNNGSESSSLMFEIVESDNVGTDEKPIHVGKVQWGNEVAMVADELLMQWAEQGSKSKLEACKEILTDLLANGPIESDAIFAEAERRGISKDTCFRAKKEMKIIARQFAKHGKFQWMLSDATTPKVDGRKF